MFEQLPPNLPTPKDAEDIFAKVDTRGAPKNLRDSSRAPVVEEKAGFRVSPKPFIIGGVVLVVLAVVVGIMWSFAARTPKKSSPIKAPATTSRPAAPSSPPRASPPPPAPVLPPPPPVAAPAVLPELEPEPIDSDGDGLIDDIELELGTNPRAIDTDLDELFDKEEVQTYGTDPRNSDTDGDTYGDGQEVKNGYDPKGPGRLLELP